MNEITRQPTIRPGQRKPYVKATRQQIDERIGHVLRLLRAGATKTEIHRAVREKFGVEWRQCDRDLSWLTRSRTLATLKTETKQKENMTRPVSASASPVENLDKSMITSEPVPPSTELDDGWN